MKFLVWLGALLCGGVALTAVLVIANYDRLKSQSSNVRYEDFFDGETHSVFDLDFRLNEVSPTDDGVTIEFTLTNRSKGVVVKAYQGASVSDSFLNKLWFADAAWITQKPIGPGESHSQKLNVHDVVKHHDGYEVTISVLAPNGLERRSIDIIGKITKDSQIRP